MRAIAWWQSCKHRATPILRQKRARIRLISSRNLPANGEKLANRAVAPGLASGPSYRHAFRLCLFEPEGGLHAFLAKLDSARMMLTIKRLAEQYAAKT